MATEAMKPFYVYEILNEHGVVIYIGKGFRSRVVSSLRERQGHSYNIVKRFELESKAYEYEKKHIAKHTNLLNANKGGFGGFVLKGNKDYRLMQEIGTRAFVARMLLNYHRTFKYLASKVDKYYTKELQDIFNNMDTDKLYEVGYGNR